MKPGEAFGVEADVASGYAWDGILQLGRPVALASAWASVSGFTLTAVAVRPLGRAVSHGPDESSDLELAAERRLGPIVLTPVVEFSSGHESGDLSERATTEVSLEISRDLGAAALFTSQSVDNRAHRGAYLGTLGIGRARARGHGPALTWSARVGWASPEFNEAYLGRREPALNFVDAELGLVCPLGMRGYVRPHVGFSDNVSPALRSQVAHPLAVAAGIATGAEF